MVKVKSAAESQKNYEDSTALVGTRYTAGVNTATWQAEALKAQPLYEAQMSNPTILARRTKGIQKVSDSSWRTDTIAKGASIIAARMKAAAPKQIAGYAPYRAALEALTLPDRSPDPMQNLIARAGAVVQAMVNTKNQQG